MNSPPSHVIIIGAGLGGTALAIALAKRSIPSTIYELRAARGDIGGSVSLASNALRLLDRLAVWTVIASQGFQYENMRLVNERGSWIGDFVRGSWKLYGYPVMCVQRSILLKALHEEAARRGIEIRFSKKAIRVEQDDDAATVHFEDGTQETAALVVGFDGIHSRVRKSVLDEDVVPRYTGLTNISGMAPRARITFPTANYALPCCIFGTKGMFGMSPHDPAGEQVGCAAMFDEFKKDKTREEWAEFARTQALDYIKDRYKSWPEPVKSLMAALTPGEVHIWPIYDVPEVVRWHQNRVVIAGDAAHATLPAGQGAAQAFEDAALLARALSLVSESYPLHTALDRWEAKRRERMVSVYALTLGRDGMRESSWWFQIVKEWAMCAYIYFKGATVSADLNAYDTELVDLGVNGSGSVSEVLK